MVRPKLQHFAWLLLAAAYLASLWLIVRRAGAADPARVTIRLSHWQLEGTVREAIEAVIARYEEINPRVHVIPVVVPDSIYRQWMQTNLAGDTAPDLIEYTSYWGRIEELAPRYFQSVSREVSEPNPYNRGTPLEGVPWRDTFMDDMSGPDGYIPLLRGYYAPTVAMFTLRIFYNRTLLRELTGRDAPPATWREFLALCALAQKHRLPSGRALVPMASSWDNSRWLAEPVIQGLTGRLSTRLDRDHTLSMSYWEVANSLLAGEWSFRTPELANALAVFRDIGNFSQPGFVQMTRDVAMLYFLRGDALMICAGSWDASSLRREAPFEVGAFRLPLPGAEDPQFGPATLGPLSDGQVQTGMAFYLNKNSSHQAEAIDFQRFLTSAEGNQIFVNVSQWLPAIRTVKPTEFSRQFLPFYDGYYWVGSYFMGTGVNTNRRFLREMHRLYGPTGSVESMQSALDEMLPRLARDELELHVRNSREAFKAEDIAATAAHFLGESGTRLLAPPVRLEEKNYHTRAALRSSPPTP
jgi:ABC-type glycerol-3-phosphate transport system substrate-binding protein